MKNVRWFRTVRKGARAAIVVSLLLGPSPLVAQAQQGEKPILLDMTQVHAKENSFNAFVVTSLAWSPDGQTLAVGGEAENASDDGTLPWSQGNLVQLWDVSRRKNKRVFKATPTPSNGTVAELAWSSDETFLAARHSSLQLGVLTDAQTWNVRTGRVTTVKTNFVSSPQRSLSVVTGTPHLAADRQAFSLVRAEERAHKDVCIVERRSFATGKLLSTRLFPVTAPPAPNNTQCAALSNDSRTLAVLTGAEPKKWTLQLFDVRTSKLLRRLALTLPQLPLRVDPTHSVRSGIGGSDFQPHLAFSQAESTLVALVGYSSLLMVNTRTGARQSVVTTPKEVQSFALSSDGSQLAIQETSARLTLWNAQAGKLIRELAPAKYNTTSLGDSDSQSLHLLAFSPDSSLLAVAMYNSNVALWPVR